MMDSVNKVILIGRLGREPELRWTPNANAICNVSMATNTKWKDKNDGPQERTDWHNLVIWGKLAEEFKTTAFKGSLVYIEGSLQTRSWEKGGEKRYITEINVRNFINLESQKNTSKEKEEIKSDLLEELG